MRRILFSLCCLALFPAAALSEWPAAGRPVAAGPGFQGDLIAVSAGGDLESFRSMIVLWTDTSDPLPGGPDLYWGVVDPAGFANPGGDGYPAVVLPGFQGYAAAALTGSNTPGSSTVVVAWNDDRSGPLDVYAERLSGSPWSLAGVPVCTAIGIQHALQVVGNAGGFTTIAWLDQRDGFDAVYAQQLDADGVPQWTANGVPACATAFTRGGLSMVAGPDGGAYLGWWDTRTGSPRTYVLLLDANGALAPGWPANGVAASTEGQTTLHRLVADGEGGVYVTMWTGANRPVAQRLDASGLVHTGWSSAGAALRDTPVEGLLQDAVAFAGGLVAIWAEDVEPDKPISLDLRAQYLLGDGTRAPGWDADGVVVCDEPGDQVGARLADGPAIVAVWEDSRSILEGPDVYALRLLENGVADPDWTPNGVKVAGGNGRQYSPRPVWDGLSATMIAYGDDHDFDLAESDVYAQIVNRSGRVDVAPRTVGGPRLAAPVPNPAQGDVNFALSWPSAERVRADVLDAVGRRVRSLETAAGAPATLRWDLRDDAGRRVEPGIYFVRVRGGGSEASRTVVVRR